jgi:hypothetical protein
MIAAFQEREGRFAGVQRTWLAEDGMGKAPVEKARMNLGSPKGCAVRLCPAGHTLAITEGVEDALALRQMTDLATWATIGTGGFSSFEPPPQVRKIIIAPDGDQAGDKAAEKAGDRFEKMGLEVGAFTLPPGRDFADMLGDFEERIAICTIDGGLTEEVAVAIARNEIFEVLP